ncbi:DUF397 domain-containing protein [Labedaea rhizosphaerae]|uniref:DUF397 domain-containing protein n=1 Tax=Labedaea rhizosphaerae TaxID=598644 RepID=UPI00105DA2FA|nr:DUF397 domain-containing protein [Labedaea rhizosphaerae]
MARAWRTSSHSGDNGNCVQVSLTTTDALVRDSKNTTAPVLDFTPAAWRTLLTRLDQQP